jgi:hypothetical protein
MLIFKEILEKGLKAGFTPGRTIAAREWYRDSALQLQNSPRLAPSKVVRSFDQKRKVSRMEPGYMYLFKYDPKTKEDLPYYDTFPLIFPIETYPDGFLGINFHYLPHMLRARLMNAIYSVTTDRRYDSGTRVLLTYRVLSSASKYKAFKPTVKRYLYSQVRSPFLEITAREWDIALFLPLEKFRKAGKDTVWADSRAMI